MKPAATIDRNFRTFLLMSQFEAKAIGSRIALARDEAGLTQEQLAEMASFSKRSLQDYEAGKTIPYKHMREIGALLNREVSWFLHGEPQKEEGVAEQLEAIRLRLEALEGQLENVPTQDDLQRGLDVLRAAIDARANPGTRPGSTPAATRDGPE